ncbi:hypothetical protein K3495_g13254 [Podosphaera aphanis]|nr:hypothetical protein K3495_g13254 [Podosphaera aphanis]
MNNFMEICLEPRIVPPSTHLRINTQSPIRKSKSNNNKLWKVQETPGKGFGLIAQQCILPGTLILSEAPLITTACITTLSPTITEFELGKAIDALPAEKREAYFSLHNKHADTDPKHPLAGIVRSNVYPLGVNSNVGGIFQNIARINHSCLPNAVQYWNHLLGRETVYCVRQINVGEEITLSYHIGGPSATRQQVLFEQFGFECRCELCSLPAKQLAVSDARLKRAQELDYMIGDLDKCFHQPEEVIAACFELYEIFELEKIKDGRLARLLYDAFQLCNMHSDLARASCFAEDYCRTKVISEGPDSLNALEMQAVSRNPRNHPSFGHSTRWMSLVRDRPTLNHHEFQKWLWREQ